MTAYEQSKQELRDIASAQQHPVTCLQKANELTSLLASVNEEMAGHNQKVYKLIAKGVEEGHSVASSESVAKATDEYREYLKTKGMAGALENAVVGLRKHAEYLASEIKIQSGGDAV